MRSYGWGPSPVGLLPFKKKDYYAFKCTPYTWEELIRVCVCVSHMHTQAHIHMYVHTEKGKWVSNKKATVQARKKEFTSGTGLVKDHDLGFLISRTVKNKVLLAPSRPRHILMISFNIILIALLIMLLCVVLLIIFY